jgi:hypothetical protein
MSGIDFHEENEFHIKSRRLLGEPETPTMVRFLLRSGFAKNEKQALYILIGVVFIALSSVFFIVRGNSDTGRIDYVKTPSGQKIETEEYIKMLGRGENPLE